MLYSVGKNPVDDFVQCAIDDGDGDGDGVADDIDVDDDNDGLIEIATAEELGNIRHDLDGTHYDEDDDDATNNIGSNAGCPTSGCNGYELANNIDLFFHYQLCSHWTIRQSFYRYLRRQ